MNIPCTNETYLYQWRIQDFPLGWGAPSRWGGCRPPMWVLFAENICGNERIGSCWGGGICWWCPPWIRQWRWACVSKYFFQGLLLTPPYTHFRSPVAIGLVPVPNETLCLVFSGNMAAPLISGPLKKVIFNSLNIWKLSKLK